MTKITNTGLILLSTVIAVGGLGCSGKTEDVRINLCREMTDRMLESMRPIEWKTQTTEFRKVGDAAIKLGFHINKEGYENTIVTSTCFFEYDLVEESAVDHANPLFAYSSVPYKMTMQGKEVPQEVFSRILKDEQLEPFKEFFNQLESEYLELKNR